MSPDKQRVSDPRTAPGLAAPRATGSDGREARDDVARSETSRTPQDADAVGEKGRRGFARHIECAAPDGAGKRATPRGGRAAPAERPVHDPEDRVH